VRFEVLRTVLVLTELFRGVIVCYETSTSLSKDRNISIVITKVSDLCLFLRIK